MLFCAGVHQFRDHLADYVARLAAGYEVTLYTPRATLLVVPTSEPVDGLPSVSISTFRPHAGRWLRHATDEPVLLTWYRRPVALIRRAPDGLQPNQRNEVPSR
ncbi:MAG: hypothetical protein ACRDG7_05795 [Candidatus Limnocylindria bacterium]